MKSQCISAKHPEYSCLIKWGVSSKKFSPDKWCSPCLEKHSQSYIVAEYNKDKIPTNEPKKRGRPKKNLVADNNG